MTLTVFHALKAQILAERAQGVYQGPDVGLAVRPPYTWLRPAMTHKAWWNLVKGCSSLWNVVQFPPRRLSFSPLDLDFLTNVFTMAGSQPLTLIGRYPIPAHLQHLFVQVLPNTVSVTLTAADVEALFTTPAPSVLSLQVTRSRAFTGTFTPSYFPNLTYLEISISHSFTMFDFSALSHLVTLKLKNPFSGLTDGDMDPGVQYGFQEFTTSLSQAFSLRRLFIYTDALEDVPQALPPATPATPLPLTFLHLETRRAGHLMQNIFLSQFCFPDLQDLTFDYLKFLSYKDAFPKFDGEAPEVKTVDWYLQRLLRPFKLHLHLPSFCLEQPLTYLHVDYLHDQDQMLLFTMWVQDLG